MRKLINLLSILEISLILSCASSSRLDKGYTTIRVYAEKSRTTLDYQVPVEYSKYFETFHESGKNSFFYSNGDWLLLYALEFYDLNKNRTITKKEIDKKDKKFGTIIPTNDFYKN